MSKRDMWLIPLILSLGGIAFLLDVIWWRILIACIVVSVGILETISYLMTKKTISQNFTAWAEIHRVKMYIVFLLMILAIVSLIFHLI